MKDILRLKDIGWGYIQFRTMNNIEFEVPTVQESESSILEDIDVNHVRFENNTKHELYENRKLSIEIIVQAKCDTLEDVVNSFVSSIRISDLNYSPEIKKNKQYNAITI